MVALVEAEVEVVGVLSLILPLIGVEVVVEAQKALKREGLEVEEDTPYLVVVEGRPHLAWKEVVVEVQLWELLKVVGEEHLFPWQEEEEGLSYVEGEEVVVVLPVMVVEVVVLAFVVHF